LVLSPFFSSGEPNIPGMGGMGGIAGAPKPCDEGIGIEGMPAPGPTPGGKDGIAGIAFTAGGDEPGCVNPAGDDDGPV
jgi:hypothetical protein